jgi:hypothetical protein
VRGQGAEDVDGDVDAVTRHGVREGVLDLYGCEQRKASDNGVYSARTVLYTTDVSSALSACVESQTRRWRE